MSLYTEFKEKSKIDLEGLPVSPQMRAYPQEFYALVWAATLATKTVIDLRPDFGLSLAMGATCEMALKRLDDDEMARFMAAAEADQELQRILEIDKMMRQVTEQAGPGEPLNVKVLIYLVISLISEHKLQTLKEKAAADDAEKGGFAAPTAAA
jgi:hypothetical protein